MKFFSTVLVASLFSIGVLGQNIEIGAPAQGSTVIAGSQIIVEVDRPNSLTPSSDVAVVIAIASCSDDTCPDPANILGSILYQGSFNPQYSANSSDHLPPHQNYEVTIPASLQKGLAQLSVLHLTLIEAGPQPFFETKTTTVTVN